MNFSHFILPLLNLFYIYINILYLSVSNYHFLIKQIRFLYTLFRLRVASCSNENWICSCMHGERSGVPTHNHLYLDGGRSPIWQSTMAVNNADQSQHVWGSDGCRRLSLHARFWALLTWTEYSCRGLVFANCSFPGCSYYFLYYDFAS